MKIFTSTFKLYAYKQYDKCDLSIKINDYLVLTVKLTHDEIKKIFNEYNINDPENNRYGIQFESKAGQYWFVMLKKHFEVIRITLSVNGIDYNFRISYNDWDMLRLDYEQQMSNPMPWDEK